MGLHDKAAKMLFQSSICFDPGLNYSVRTKGRSFNRENGQIVQPDDAQDGF
jgi:hypothetical protein